jgi:hypothetical protein
MSTLSSQAEAITRVLTIIEQHEYMYRPDLQFTQAAQSTQHVLLMLWSHVECLYVDRSLILWFSEASEHRSIRITGDNLPPNLAQAANAIRGFSNTRLMMVAYVILYDRLFSHQVFVDN